MASKHDRDPCSDELEEAARSSSIPRHASASISDAPLPLDPQDLQLLVHQPSREYELQLQQLEEARQRTPSSCSRIVQRGLGRESQKRSRAFPKIGSCQTSALPSVQVFVPEAFACLWGTTKSMCNYKVSFEKNDSDPHQLRIEKGSARMTCEVSLGTDILGLISKHLSIKTDVLILVGASKGLDPFLGNDLRSILEHYKVDVSKFNDKDFFFSGTGEARLRFLRLNSVDEFKQEITVAFSNTFAPNLDVIYNGHGTHRGGLVFEDEEFYGHEFLPLLESISFALKVRFILNCCFGLQFFCNLKNDTDISKLLGSLDGFARIFGAREISFSKYYEKSKEPLSTEEVKKTQSAFLQLFARCEPQLGERSPFSYPNNHCTINFFPLSFGLLPSIGSIHDFLGVPYEDDPISLPPPRAILRYAPLEGSSSPVFSSPTFTSFRAQDGDSILFRWHDAAILIDGGRSVKSCFWPVVNTLPKLDAIILTHGDCDHTTGLKGFFKTMENTPPGSKLPGIGNVVILAVAKKPDLAATSSGSHQPSMPRFWNHANELYDLAKSLHLALHDVSKIFSGEILFQRPLWGDCLLTITCVLPTKELHTQAIDELEAYRGALTPINECSLCLLFEMRTTNQTEYALLTGDANASDIIEALTNLGHLDKTFAMVDMPHHGSKTNNPKLFLESIKTKKILVSTGGHRFNHPDPETIEALSGYLNNHPDAHLYFNYDDHRISKSPRSRSKSVQDYIPPGPRVFFSSQQSVDLICDFPIDSGPPP